MLAPAGIHVEELKSSMRYVNRYQTLTLVSGEKSKQGQKNSLDLILHPDSQSMFGIKTDLNDERIPFPCFYTK